MSIESTDVPVDQFEFPSVTVCSQTRLSKSRLEQILKGPKFRTLTYEELKMTMKIMMRPESAFNRTDKLDLIHKKLVMNGVTSEELINATLYVIFSRVTYYCCSYIFHLSDSLSFETKLHK